MTRDEALTAFDHARDRFLDAFARVPDDALDFLKPGDDYAIGGLLVHVSWSMTHYGAVLADMVAAGFGEVHDEVRPADMERVGAEARRGLQAAERAGALAGLGHEHDRLAGQMRQLSEADFERQAPVFYTGASEPFPTSAAMIAGWMTDHYHEHVPHIDQLLSSRRERHLL